MTFESPAASDPGSGVAPVGAWAAAGEQSRVRREIVRRVRLERHGKTAAVVAAELRCEFAAARMPLPPEEARNLAHAIAEHHQPAVPLLGELLDIAVERTIPPDMRPKECRIIGEQWISVPLTDSDMSRIVIRNYRRLQDFTGQLNPSAPLNARLISMPGPNGSEQVAVLLGSTFVGTLTAESAAGILPALTEAEAANQKLTVGARIDETGRLLVSLPAQGAN